MHIKPDTLSLLWRIESMGTGLHHSWNFDFAAVVPPTVLQYPRMVKYVAPDTLYSIVSGFQCVDDVITVANYNNVGDYIDENNATQNSGYLGGSRAPDSSVGPTRDGRQKPDIAATGTGVFGALCVSWQAYFNANLQSSMAPGGMHFFGTGTSAASPVVAGLAALYLQANPGATSGLVRSAITNCAYHDGFTGNVIPDLAWGYGKLDGLAAMQCVILTGKNEMKLNTNSVEYFPNPFNDNVNIKFKSEVKGEIYVYNVEGKLLFTDKIYADTYDLKAVNLNSDLNGLLFVRVVSQTDNMAFKIVRAK
jgi:subtilisin family serine protease